MRRLSLVLALLAAALGGDVNGAAPARYRGADGLDITNVFNDLSAPVVAEPQFRDVRHGDWPSGGAIIYHRSEVDRAVLTIDAVPGEPGLGEPVAGERLNF